MEDNCNELLMRCAKQDTQAFRQLYEICAPRLYSLALRLLKKESLAEEILQEAFLKIWNSASAYSPDKGNALTWMATVTRNKALDKLRALKARPQETEISWEGLDFMENKYYEPDSQAATEQGIHQLMNCLEDLQQEHKECILLSYYYGHTHQELADKLDKPLGTIKAWIRRGLEKLRVCLE